MSSLVSQDLDGDGIVEIPTQPDEAGLLNMSQSRRMDFIVWMDYTSPHPEKSFGLLDKETNCYIELPMEWEGNLKLTDSEQYDGAVELRTVDEDQLVMTLRLVRTTSSLKGWTRLGIVASRQIAGEASRMWRSVIKLPPVQGAVSAQLKNGGTVHGTSACR